MAFSAFDHHGLVAGPPTEQIDCLCGCGNRATVGVAVKKVDQGAETAQHITDNEQHVGDTAANTENCQIVPFVCILCARINLLSLAKPTASKTPGVPPDPGPLRQVGQMLGHSQWQEQRFARMILFQLRQRKHYSFSLIRTAFA